MKLSVVIPWGRSFDEYRRMFVLTGDDLAGTILGCGDGPASFNAEATARATASSPATPSTPSLPARSSGGSSSATTP